MNRSARTHKSTKIPNVKLRPAPQRPSAAEDDAQDGYWNAHAGPSRSRGVKNKGEGRSRDVLDVDVSAMDRQKIRRMEEEDGVVDHLSQDAFHQTPSQLPFYKHILTYTSVSGEEKSILNPLLESMGVESILPALTTDCTILLSRTHDSAKYACAIEKFIPVFQPELVEEVHRRWIEGDEVGDVLGVEWAGFRLKAFHGTKIAVTGIEPISRRQEIIALIVENGGVYSKNLDRSCTHLIVADKAQNPRDSQSDPRRSAKVDFALAQSAEDVLDEEDGSVITFAGPAVVWEGWLWDCVAYGGRLGEDEWDLRIWRDPPPMADSRAEALKIEREERARRIEKNLLAARDLLDAVVSEDQSGEEGRHSMGYGAVEGAPSGELVPVEDLEPARMKSRSDSRTAGRAGKQALGKGKGGSYEELDKLLSAIDQARQPQGGAGTSATANANASHAESNPGGQSRPRLLAAQTTMDVKGKISPMLRQSVLHASRSDAFATPTLPIPSSALSVAGIHPSTTGSITSTGMIAPTAQPPPSSSAAAPEYTTPDLFLGLKFSHPLRHGENGQREKAMMEDVLIKCGAKLVTEEDRLKGALVDYIVIRLQAGRPPLPNISPNTQLVTDCWVERCMYRKEVVSADEHLVLRPLEKKMPLTGASGLSIHITGFDEENTFYYKRLIRAVGADFSVAFSRKRTTHLLSQTAAPTGLKIAKAQEWQVPVIRAEWLIDSVRAGALLPFEGYVIDPTAMPATAPSTSAKKPLGGDTSANLCTGPVALSLSSASALSEQHSKENAMQVDSESVEGKRASQKSSSESRRLGLLPTEVNISHGGVKSTKRSMVEDSVMDIDVGPPAGGIEASLAPPSKVRDVPSSPGTPRTERPPPRFAVPNQASTLSTVTPALKPKFKEEAGGLRQILTPELMRELEQADVHAEARQTRVLRRPRQNARNRNPFAANRPPPPIPGPSRLYSPTPFLLDTETGDAELEAEEDPADQSLRVVYADPAAEREKKRLLDAFGDKKTSKRARRS